MLWTGENISYWNESWLLEDDIFAPPEDQPDDGSRLNAKDLLRTNQRSGIITTIIIIFYLYI